MIIHARIASGTVAETTECSRTVHNTVQETRGTSFA